MLPENIVVCNISTYSDLFLAISEQSDAIAIVGKLGALPLALDQAGSYISAMQIPFGKYLVRFESAFAEVTAKKPPKVVWQYRSDTVFTTWEVSFNALSPTAQELLLLLGFFDNQSIPEELLPLGRLSNEFKIGEISLLFHLVHRPGRYSNRRYTDSVDDAIGEIFSLSLAKRKDLDTIWVHPLVHSWSRERLDQCSKTRKAFHAISLVAASLSFTHGARKAENWVRERMFMPHIQKCFHHICRDGSVGNTETGASQRSDIKTLADILEYSGESTTAGELYQWILTLGEGSLGKDHPDMLAAFHSMANVFWGQAKYDAALEWYRRALVEEEISLGKDHPTTLSTVYSMANVFFCQGKYDEALEWYRRALVGEEVSLGKDHPDTLATVYSMANVFFRQGKHDEALEWCRRALIGEEMSLGKDHPDTLTTVHFMANMFWSQGKYDEALEWYRRALSGREKSLGKDHPDTLRAVHAIANVLRDQGKYDEALERYRRALVGWEKSLGNDHPDTFTAVKNIAGVFRIQGKEDEALELFRRALAGQEKSLGKDHPDTLATSRSITELLQAQRPE